MRSMHLPITMVTVRIRARMKRVRSMHQARVGKSFVQLAILFLGALLLAGSAKAEPPIATPTQTPPGDRAASSPGQNIPTQLSKQEEECTVKGGAWRRTYPCSPFRPCSNDFSCELPNPKAGTPCSSSSECGAYLCVPQSANAGARVEGRCDRFGSSYGCRTSVENGVVRQICTD